MIDRKDRTTPRFSRLAPRPLMLAAEPCRALVSRLFAREAVSGSITTCMHFQAEPQTIWNSILFYEEVPRVPPLLLRTFLSCPLGTEGNKTRIGELVRCIYHAGHLIKSITAVTPGRLLQFEVVEQHLGFEDCVLTRGGSYSLSPCGHGTDVTLVTNYWAYLHPRGLWSLLEALLVHRLHRHILDGLRTALLPARSPARATLPSPRWPLHRSPGGFSCTASRACSRR